MTHASLPPGPSVAIEIESEAGSRGPRGEPLCDGDQRWLREQVTSHGVVAVARRLGIARTTVAAAAGSCGLRAGTRTLLRDAINRARDGV